MMMLGVIREVRVVTHPLGVVVPDGPLPDDEALPVGKGAELDEPGALLPGTTGPTGTTGTPVGTAWPGVTVTYWTTVETEGQVVGQTGQPLGTPDGPATLVVAGERGMTTVVLWPGLSLTGTTTVVD